MSSLTNEELGKEHANLFDLVNYAISLADNMIKSGREPRVKSDIMNRSHLILEEIKKGVDKLDDIEFDYDSNEESEYRSH
jgi:hypothetical protein